MNQLKLTLLQPRILNGKKEHRITFTCSEDFKRFADLMAQIQKTDLSKLGHRYFIEGMSRDLGTIFIAEPHLEDSLKDILARSQE